MVRNALHRWIPLLVLALILPARAQTQKTIEKTFESKDEIRIDLILGDCTLSQSPDDKIHIRLDYTYDDRDFEARFRETDRYVEVKEEFSRGNNPRGHSEWSFGIPRGMEAEIESATGNIYFEKITLKSAEGNTGTGDIEMKSVQGEFDMNTGTGNVTVIDSEGEFELNSGTGRVRITGTRGRFDANSGTGDVFAKDITIDFEADFNSGTGDAEVVGPRGEGFDLHVGSGTDDAVLDMNGRPLQGYFEFTCHLRRGDIDAPVKFDREEKTDDRDNETLRKMVTVGDSKNRYFVRTGTGSAVLKK